MKPYKQGESKISKKQWDRLNTFFKTIEPPAQDELYATGDHWTISEIKIPTSKCAVSAEF